MANYVPLNDFTHHLRNYFLQNPEKLPQNIDVKQIQIKPFQNAWTDNRLESDHRYIRYMDILFFEESEPTSTYLHSYIITYLRSGSIIEVMKMDLKQ